MVPEEQQVQVDLARAPALTLDPAHGSLQALERDEQRHRPRRRIGTGRHAQRDDRVEEVVLRTGPTGRVRYSRETPARCAPGSAASADTARCSDVRAAPTLAPRPM